MPGRCLARLSRVFTQFYSALEQTHIAMVIFDEIRNLPRQRLGLPMPSDRRMLRIARALADNPADNRRLEEWASWTGTSTRTVTCLSSANFIWYVRFAERPVGFEYFKT
jgi:hypothetical protein